MFIPTEAVPKEEFNTLKKKFAELEKKHDELLLGKAWLEREFQQKSQDLDTSERKRAQLETQVSTLQHDLDDATKGSEILDKELLRK